MRRPICTRLVAPSAGLTPDPARAPPRRIACRLASANTFRPMSGSRNDSPLSTGCANNFICRETGGQPRGFLAASPAARELPQLSNPAWRQAEAASQGVGGFFRRRGLDRLQVPPLGARGDVQPLRAQIGLTDGRFYPQPDRRRNLGRRLAGDGEQLQEVIADHAAPARPRRWLPADRTPGALPAPGWPRQAGRRPGG